MVVMRGDIEAGDGRAAPRQGLYVILSLQLFLTVIVVVVVVKVRASLYGPNFFDSSQLASMGFLQICEYNGFPPNLQSPGAGGEGEATAYMIITCIINTISLALCVDQFYMDWTCVNGDLVFNNFCLVDKLVSCFKLYVTGYDAVHTKGSEIFGFVCLLGCFLHWFAIVYYLLRSHRTRVRTRVLGMISIMAAGVSLLCRGMVIHNVWNTDVVPAIIIFIVSIDGGLLIRAQIKKTGGNEQSLRDLVIKLVETTISIIRLIDLKGQTHKPWDANKILHLEGSILSVLIGICLIGIMVYNVHILVISKLVEWRGEITRVFAVVEDGNAEEQAAEEGVVHVELTVLD